MRVKGIALAVLAAGVLLVAPGLEGARADQNHRHWQNQQQFHGGMGYGYGWWGQRYFGDRHDGGYAYGKRARNHYGGLNHWDRQRLFKMRHRFDSERDFRRFLRHHKPGLFTRYMDQTGHQRQVYRHQRSHRHAW